MTPLAPIRNGYIVEIRCIFHDDLHLIVRHYYPIKKGYNDNMENMFVVVCFVSLKKSPKGTYLAINTLGDRSYLDFISVAAASPAARMPRPILPMRRSTDLVALAAPFATGAGFTSKEVLISLDVNSIFIMSPIMIMGVQYGMY
jgi:hypothetical protein